jgi:hypothetical protein
MDNTFTTGLYIFSSLIQADAAILGLGAVFVIYRLQSLYSQEQSHVDILHQYPVQRVQRAVQIVMEGDQQKIDEELKMFERQYPGYLFRSLKFLSENPSHIAAARKGFIPSLLLVAVHCFLSAACLWWMSLVCVSQLNIQIVGAIVTLLFGVILLEVIAASQVALDAKPFIWPFPLGRRIWDRGRN